MDNEKLLQAIGLNHLMREQRKNQVTTRRQTETIVRLFFEVMWFGSTT